MRLLLSDIQLTLSFSSRVQAVVTLIEARHSIGAETEATLKLWKQIETAKELRRVADARKTDLVLVALEQRRDREFLSGPAIFCIASKGGLIIASYRSPFAIPSLPRRHPSLFRSHC